MQKMVHLPLRIERSVIDTIDGIVRQNPDYRSRSDYIRKKLYESAEEERLRTLIRETAKEIKARLDKRGVIPKLLTRQDRIRITNKFLKERGFKIPR